MKQPSAFLIVGVAVGLVGGYSLGHGISPDERTPVSSAPAPVADPAPVPTADPAPAADPAPVAAPVPAADPAPVPAADPAPGAAPVPAPATASIDRDLDSALASKDPKRIVAYVRDLARGGRSTWPQAAKALLEVARAIEADNRLGLNITEFHKAARQDAFAPLYVDAIENPQGYEAGFRRLAVRELPWTNQADVDALLAKRLVTEKDAGVARQIAGSLEDRPDPALLNELQAAARAQTDGRIRWAIVQAIDATPGDEALRALQALVASEPNKNVKHELEMAVRLRSATVAGYLITEVVPNGQAAKAGVRVGDTLASYANTAIDSNEALYKAKASVPQGSPVVLGLVRDGQTLTLTISGGQIGIDGRFVKPRS